MGSGEETGKFCFLQEVVDQKLGLFPGSVAGLIEIGAGEGSQNAFGEGSYRLINT